MKSMTIFEYSNEIEVLETLRYLNSNCFPTIHYIVGLDSIYPDEFPVEIMEYTNNSDICQFYSESVSISSKLSICILSFYF